MSTAGELAVQAGTVTAPAASLHRLPVYFACSVLAVLVTYVFGKDMAWDTLNYHLYAGFNAVNDRFGQDYFPAGPQSYFNPYPYVPFYWLVRAGLPALAIGSVLAIAHSAILWLTYELGVCISPSPDPLTKVTIGLLAVAMAVLNPILLQQIGSPFADITTATLVVAGWLLLVRSVYAPRLQLVIGAAVLLGIACALKPTNAVHAVPAVVVLVMLPRPWPDRIRYGLGYGVALAMAFIAAAAPWSYRLERAFGNPFFPLFNSVFRSSDFTTEPLKHYRFIPATLGEALWRPFAILDPQRMVHEELRAPDIRYAALALLIVALLGRWLWLRFVRRPERIGQGARAAFAPLPIAVLGSALALDWTLWLTASGNGRYFLAMACIGGTLVVALLFWLFAARPKVRNYVLITLFGLQAVQVFMGTEYRWNPTQWAGAWFNVEIPSKLAAEPNLYLTVGTQSNSFLALYLPKSSGLINITGNYTLGPDGAHGARIGALLRAYAPHVRVLMSTRHPWPDATQLQQFSFGVAGLLEPFALQVDPSDCATIVLHGAGSPSGIKGADSGPASVLPQDTYFLTCHLVSRSAKGPELAAQRRAMDLVFDRLEDACPELLQPRRMWTEHPGERWQRIYMNTDLIVWTEGGQILARNPFRAEPPVFLGTVSGWAATSFQLACGRSNGRAVVRLRQ
jgi:hypothetical protein